MNSTDKTSTESSEKIFSLVDVERTNRITKLVKETCGLSGVMAELGVFQGGSALAIAKACPEKTLHLFDTFHGIPEDDIDGSHKKGEFSASMVSVMKALQGWNVEFHVGVFPDTIKGLENLQFSFVHLDADTYQSTTAGIKFFRPRMVKGGVMVFDDYDWMNCHGVGTAVHENFPATWIEAFRQQCYVKL
jgi:O-methyltransferase